MTTTVLEAPRAVEPQKEQVRARSRKRSQPEERAQSNAQAQPEEQSQSKAQAQSPSKGKGRRNKELGRKGEEAAARFLYRRGYEILERNWTCFAGEADIIAKDDDALVFVEVKTRKNCEKGFPSEHVSASKRERYEKIALAYVAECPDFDGPVRFDVIAIVVVGANKAMIRHDIDAFSVM